MNDEPKEREFAIDPFSEALKLLVITQNGSWPVYLDLIASTIEGLDDPKDVAIIASLREIAVSLRVTALCQLNDAHLKVTMVNASMRKVRPIGGGGNHVN